MSWYILEPRDPLLVRDGRPFTPGSEGARSLDAVPPSVTTGALRTRVWQATPGGLGVTAAKALPVAGPLLAELEQDRDRVKALWLTAPRDCVLYDPANGSPMRAFRRFGLRAAAAPFPDGKSSLPDGLLPVVPVAKPLPKDKPAKSAPVFWSGAVLRHWLANAPKAEDSLSTDSDATRGPLVHEPRVHVALKPDGSRTGEDGKLFQSDGLRFTDREQAPADGMRAGALHRLGLLVRCAHPALQPGAVTLGGERRLSVLGALEGEGPEWPAPTITTTRARVVLLTPALFAEGAVPGEIAGARVIAAAVGRPQTISGWDMAWGSSGGPKPTRRMAPAGSVYWVDLSGLDSSGWLAAVHFRGICTDVQDNLDGFGLAVVGVSA